MIKRIRTYFKSTFVRYILSYLVLMALLVGALTVYMYSYYRSSVYDSTISAETSLAWQLKYRADGYLGKLGSFARVMQAVGMRGDISDEITELTRDDEALVYVYAASQRQLYSASGRVNADQWLASVQYENLSAGEIGSELFEPRELTLIQTQSVTIDGETRQMLSISAPIGSLGSVICVLPETSLLSLAGSDDSGSNRYIIHNGEIAARVESFSMSESKVLEAGATVNRAVSEVKNLQGVDYLFIAMPGETEGIAYVSVQPLTGIRAKAAGVWLGFMAVLLAFAIPCTLFMVYISRKNLAPILEIGKHFGKNGEKYSDEISTIVSGIEELEGRNREIQYSSLSARRHVYARNLVTGAFENPESAKEAGRELSLNIDKPCYEILLIGAPRERRQDDYLDSLIALAPENLCCAGTDLMESNQFMLICFADSEKDIEAFARELLNEKLIAALHLPVALSAAHTDLKEMSNAYLEATSAYESRFFMGENRLLRFSEIPLAAGKDVSSADYAEEIRAALIQGDMNAVDKCLDKLRAALQSENMNLFSFRRVYNDVIGAIMSQADEQEYSNAEIYDLFSLSGCRSVEELEQILRGVCESIVSSKNPEEQLPLLQRVMRIMTVNYTDSDFTLSQAAELAGITPVRLTGEFKTKMGMTPMDYLTMLRMEEAKKLLRQTDLNVSEVCGRSGYADASSFTRRFKQYTGMTPLQYRQSDRNKEQ